MSPGFSLVRNCLAIHVSSYPLMYSALRSCRLQVTNVPEVCEMLDNKVKELCEVVRPRRENNTPGARCVEVFVLAMASDSGAPTWSSESAQCFGVNAACGIKKRTCARLFRASGGELKQIQVLLVSCLR